MQRRLHLLDTSVLVELLGVPFESDRHAEVLARSEALRQEGVELRLPAATLVEAGDHVGRVLDGTARRECARRLATVIRLTLERTAPWSFEPLEWDEALLAGLLGLPDDGDPLLVTSLATRHLEMGDLMILAEFHRLRANLDARVVAVDVWTYDAQLRAVVDEALRPGRDRPGRR